PRTSQPPKSEPRMRSTRGDGQLDVGRRRRRGPTARPKRLADRALAGPYPAAVARSAARPEPADGSDGLRLAGPPARTRAGGLHPDSLASWTQPAPVPPERSRGSPSRGAACGALRSAPPVAFG